MPLSSDVAVAPTVEGFMPENYTQVFVFLDAEIRQKLAAIRKYLSKSAPAPDELYMRFSLDDRHARNKEFGFNVSALADACIRKLLHDLTAGLITAESLKPIMDAYYQSARTDRCNVSLDDNAISELEAIVQQLEALGIEVKPKSRRGVGNRKLPLNVAIAYAYDFITRKNAN
jgi:hypothetical protein